MRLTHAPNVLVIYPDQMRFDVMGCAGNAAIQTPNLDRLAAEGVRCESAYTSFPLCCPFRASFLTGRYAHANGMFANHYPVALNQTFLADMMRRSGRRTGFIGKWHLDGGIKYGYVPPERRLEFEWFVGFNRGHSYFNGIFYRNDDPRPRTSPRYEPEVQTDHLLEFIDHCGDDAFFAMVAYGPPHPPLQMPEEYRRCYRPEDVPVRANTPDSERERAARFLSQYYGLTTSIDDQIGRVLDELDRRDLTDNTIVFVVSDHGEMAREHGLSGKKTYYEASMHVPLIIRWPRGLPAGRVVRTLIDPAVDSMPTLLELCRIAIPLGVQGRSFADQLRYDDPPARRAVFYQVLREAEGPERFPVPQRGVRTPDWLYVRDPEKPLALFDLNADPLEMNNLVEEGPADVMKYLDDVLDGHMMMTGDEWELEAVFPPPDFQTHEEGEIYRQQLLEQAIVEE